MGLLLRSGLSRGKRTQKASSRTHNPPAADDDAVASRKASIKAAAKLSPPIAAVVTKDHAPAAISSSGGAPSLEDLLMAVYDEDTKQKKKKTSGTSSTLMKGNTKAVRESTSVAASVAPTIITAAELSLLRLWEAPVVGEKKPVGTPKAKRLVGNTSPSSSAWVPQPARSEARYTTSAPTATTKADNDATFRSSYDRYDIIGTSNVNELVLRHAPMDRSELKDTMRPILYEPIVAGGKKGSGSKGGRKTSSSSSSSSPTSEQQYKLDKYFYNTVRALAHPLHNFLQHHHGLHNADEVQLMLMPKEGPIAEADARHRMLTRKGSSTSIKGGNTQKRAKGKKRSRWDDDSDDEAAEVDRIGTRRCYVATNNETLTAEGLAAAVSGWGVGGVFHVSEFVLVTGPKGQHAEQKLLRYLKDDILGLGGDASTKKGGNSSHSPSGRHGTTSPARVNLRHIASADQKALVIGERLPCAACKLFAVPYEAMAVMLPSHGHLYVSTMVGVGRGTAEGGDAAGFKPKKEATAFSQPSPLLSDPQKAADVLLANDRVLQL